MIGALSFIIACLILGVVAWFYIYHDDGDGV
jgi:hypothetical protein